MKRVITALILLALLVTLTACSDPNAPVSYASQYWPTGGLKDALGTETVPAPAISGPYEVYIRTVEGVKYISIVCDTQRSAEQAAAYRKLLHANGWFICDVADGIYYAADVYTLNSKDGLTADTPVIECAFRASTDKLEICFNLSKYNVIYHTDRFIDNDSFSDAAAMLRYIGEGFWSPARVIENASVEVEEAMIQLVSALNGAADGFDGVRKIINNAENNGYTRVDEHTLERIFGGETRRIVYTDGRWSMTNGADERVWTFDTVKEYFTYTQDGKAFEIAFDRSSGTYYLAYGSTVAALNVSDYTCRIKLDVESQLADGILPDMSQAYTVTAAPGRTAPTMFY